MSERLTLFNISQVGEAIKLITDMLLSGPITIRVSRAKRTLDQNALYWSWLTEMSAYFTERGHPLTKEEAHDLMRHKFLGHQTRLIGHTEVTKLRSTTDLDKGEMAFYTTQVDNWAASCGCYLMKPEHSEYMEYQRQQGEAA